MFVGYFCPNPDPDRLTWLIPDRIRIRNTDPELNPSILWPGGIWSAADLVKKRKIGLIHIVPTKDDLLIEKWQSVNDAYFLLVGSRGLYGRGHLSQGTRGQGQDSRGHSRPGMPQPYFYTKNMLCKQNTNGFFHLRELSVWTLYQDWTWNVAFKLTISFSVSSLLSTTSPMPLFLPPPPPISQVFLSPFIATISFSNPGSSILLNPDPVPDCCWIRIQSVLLIRIQFFSTCLSNSTPRKGHSGSKSGF
jgi:hypothetical protein